MSSRGVAAFFLGLVLAGSGTPTRALELARPAEGARLAPGGNVRVEVIPGPGEVVEQLHATALGALVAAPPGALAVDVPVPSEAVGPLAVLVFARLAGNAGALVSALVEVEPGPLERLEIGVPPRLDVVGSVAAIEVRGLFADGVVRDLTDPDTGTRYESSDPSVLAVHPSGRVQARSRGSAQVLVVSRGRSAVVTVRVDVPSPPPNGIPSADAGPDQTVPRETVVDLDGSASHDPEQEALGFSWEQVAGPLVVVRDSGNAHPHFLAPFVAAPTVLEFAVEVEDPRGAQSFPDTVRVTVLP